MVFKPGQSGNPSGRPKHAKDIRALAKRAGPEAIAGLRKLGKNARSESARVAAFTALLDRGYGKPAQTIEATVNRVDPEKIPDSELAVHIIRDSSENPVEASPDKEKLN